jgi:hypothetical protein
VVSQGLNITPKLLNSSRLRMMDHLQPQQIICLLHHSNYLDCSTEKGKENFTVAVLVVNSRRLKMMDQ